MENIDEQILIEKEKLREKAFQIKKIRDEKQLKNKAFQSKKSEDI